MKNTAITFDIDWAPDWAIDVCYRICKDQGIPATFFVTHKCDILDDLRDDVSIELAIHPNLLSGSTHGNNENEILSHCMELVPEATAMRTHGLYQTSKLFFFIAKHFPMIQTDVSLYLPNHKNLHPVDLYCGINNFKITRLPYYWEDDLYALSPDVGWDEIPKSDGLRIFNFHPIHVVLNTYNLNNYESLKSSLGSAKLITIARRDVEPYINNVDNGASTYLKRIINNIDVEQFSAITDITNTYRDKVSF